MNTTLIYNPLIVAGVEIDLTSNYGHCVARRTFINTLVSHSLVFKFEDPIAKSDYLCG